MRASIQRVIDQLATMELSIGDYVLTGGELPALVVVDAVSRLLPGVLGNRQSVAEESFEGGLLEYPPIYPARCLPRPGGAARPVVGKSPGSGTLAPGRWPCRKQSSNRPETVG